MDKEINYIYQILKGANAPMSAKDISVELYNRHGIRISKTIVKNYLWSYFRHIIKYNSEEYTYTLEDSTLIVDDVRLVESTNSGRAISLSMKGSELVVEYDKNLPIENFIKGIAMLNLSRGLKKNNVDLVKQLNRIIEIEIEDNE